MCGARVAGLPIRRTLRFTVAGTRTARLMPTARRDRRRLAAAQRRPGRLRATVTATMASARTTAHTTLPDGPANVARSSRRRLQSPFALLRARSPCSTCVRARAVCAGRGPAIGFPPSSMRLPFRRKRHSRRIDWGEGDLSAWSPRPGQYDLVTCLYVHVSGSVEEMVRRLATGVAHGGTLLLVGHHPIDPATGNATAAAGQAQVSVDVAVASLDPSHWEITVSEDRPRAHGRYGRGRWYRRQAVGGTGHRPGANYRT